jgi:hypothetical protein
MPDVQPPWIAQPDDYYERLHVERDHPNFVATLKRNYQAFAKQYHEDALGPDVPQEVKRHYQQEAAKLNVAYGVLQDRQQRDNYDHWLDYEDGYQKIRAARTQAGSSTNRTYSSSSDGPDSTSSGPHRDQDDGRRQRSWQQQQTRTPPPPRLTIQPATLDFDSIPAGQPLELTLTLTNAGGPCTTDLFRIRSPRHPAHPNHDPNHWLTIAAPQPFASPSQGTITVQCAAHTARLVPGRSYTANVYIDYCGDTLPPIPAKITAPALKDHPYTARVLAIGGIVGLIILAALVKSAFSGGSSPSSASVPQSISAAPASQRSPAPAAASPVPILASTPAPPPTPPPPPPPPPDTPPGTVLEVGQTWREGGLEPIPFTLGAAASG